MDHNAHQTRYVLGRMQHAPTYTDQKFDSTLYDESQTQYALGRMQYAPTCTDKKMILIYRMNLKPDTC